MVRNFENKVKPEKFPWTKNVDSVQVKFMRTIKILNIYNCYSTAEKASLMDGSTEDVTTTQPKPLGSGDDIVSEGVGDDSVQPPAVPPEMEDCGCCCKCCVICLTLTCRNIGLCITNCKDCTLSIGSLFNFSIEGREEAVTSFNANKPPENGDSTEDKKDDVPPGAGNQN